MNPTSEEAIQLARGILTELGAPTSVFGPSNARAPSRRRAHIDVEAGFTDDGTKRYEEAQAIYQAAGYEAGVRDMRFSLAAVMLKWASSATPHWPSIR